MSDRISEHVSLNEGIKSHTATRLNIDNVPRDLDLINMKTIAEEVFEPLRKWVGGPIAINSFYRSPKLNSAIGGSRRRCLRAYKKNNKTKYKII